MNTRASSLSFAAAMFILACDAEPDPQVSTRMTIENTASPRTRAVADIATWALAYGQDQVDVEGRRPDGTLAERTRLRLDGTAEREFFAPDGTLTKATTIPRVLLAQDASRDDICDDCYYKDLAQGDPRVTYTEEEVRFRNCTVRVEQVGSSEFYCYEIVCDSSDPLAEVVDGCSFCGDGIPYCGNGQ